MRLGWSVAFALGALACGSAPAEPLDAADLHVPRDEPAMFEPADRGAGSIQDAPASFSFVLGRSLAGLAKPGTAHSLDADLAFLREMGIDLLVSLTEEPIDPLLVRAHGMASLHLPVRDFTAPTMDQLVEFSDVTDATIHGGGAVAVHCLGGLGRTGTFLAAYFAGHGMDPMEAIARIRALRPGSIETESQERAVIAFHELRTAR